MLNITKIEKLTRINYSLLVILSEYSERHADTCEDINIDNVLKILRNNASETCVLFDKNDEVE